VGAIDGRVCCLRHLTTLPRCPVCPPARCTVAAEHAQLLQKGRQVFLKALQGNSVFDRCGRVSWNTVGGWRTRELTDRRSARAPAPDAVRRTYSFIDGVEARPNVSYVLASGCVVAFGGVLVPRVLGRNVQPVPRTWPLREHAGSTRSALCLPGAADRCRCPAGAVRLCCGV
jgi:hypothetical protein